MKTPNALIGGQFVFLDETDRYKANPILSKFLNAKCRELERKVLNSLRKQKAELT